MRTSCRFAMAVHVLAVLAYQEGDLVSSARLAASVNTNPVIIRRLLQALHRARLVETRKGAGAGSRLSRAPRRINLAEVFRAVEDGSPFIQPARKPNAACPVGHIMRRMLDEVFTAARAALEQELARHTLAHVLAAVKAAGGCRGRG